MSTTEIFTLHLYNSGGKDASASWEIERWEQIPTAPYRRAEMIVKREDRVYAANDVLRTLGMWPDGDALILTGTGRRLFEITRSKLDKGLESASYPRRSIPEQRVADRNFEALAWIESLLS